MFFCCWFASPGECFRDVMLNAGYDFASCFRSTAMAVNTFGKTASAATNWKLQSGSFVSHRLCRPRTGGVYSVQ